MKADDLPRGVMFNAYPDSIGQKLSDTLAMLQRPEFEGAFSLFYILPTFFNSDLDRGFSIIDYEINRELVSDDDLETMKSLGIALKFDMVLNHLSVGSPQFQDMLQRGDKSPFSDFFIDWNKFWQGWGELGPEGYIVPEQDCLDVLFMRKPGLPILKVRFPDGSERPYWNTFYQEITYQYLVPGDLEGIDGLTERQVNELIRIINAHIREGTEIGAIDWEDYPEFARDVIEIVERKRKYLGQMDLNAKSEQVWTFYDRTLARLRDYGAVLVRLDAFSYLHKEPCKPNFFNTPGTWEYLDRLNDMAAGYGLTLLPEIHSEYGFGLHEEVAGRGFPIYDFFLPGLVIDALDRGTSRYLLRWVQEVLEKGIRTVNMLGCHDGIPVLDLRGKKVAGDLREGLLLDAEIDAVMDRIIARGGRVKNLYGPDGKKIAYYQVNATFFSALGEDERKLRLARAIQLFMPGIPQVWYLDLFAGTNDHAAADRGGTGGHKEINRTTLTMRDVDSRLSHIVVKDQLELIKLRNNSEAFYGELEIGNTADSQLHMCWKNGKATSVLRANLDDFSFEVTDTARNGIKLEMAYH